MTPEVYRQAGELFHRVRELPEIELISAVEAACAGNEELRAQVIRLIEADRNAGDASFLERRAVEDAAKLIAPEDLALPATGTVLGNYRLGTRIGAGGMGVVYEGQDLRLARRVAIKILPAAFASGGEERIRRFQREARVVSTLNHPNIVSIFDADFDHGHHYIVMEFVEGRTLRQVAASHTLPDIQVILEWIGQTASALSAAHQAGIVHRDIKPENIMIRPDGFVKVLDFGLAKLREPAGHAASGSDLRTRPGSLAGTVRYLAPEQIMGEPAGARSDLFSLGVVAYELATGARPFDGPTDGAVFNAILNRTPPPPSAVRSPLSPEIDGLIMRALEKDPELRFQTAADLRSSCRSLSRDYIVKAPQPLRRRRSRWLATVGGLVAALAAFFFWATRQAQPLHVMRIVQITSGQTVERFVTDGTKLYYSAGNRAADIKVFQISTKGGDPLPMPQFTGMLPLDISSDRSEILLGQILKSAINEGTIDGPFPIWAADTLGNRPRRIGDLTANDVRWSPKGDEILYSKGAELRLSRSDGTQSRMLAAVKGRVLYPAWSPDGHSIRFTSDANNTLALWEVALNGTHLHELFPKWAGYATLGGAWTPDGKYFFFSAGKNGARDLWAVREGGRFFEAETPNPVRLSAGPMKAEMPAAHPGERRVFFQGTVDVGELVRYDQKSDRWTSYLGGLAATQLDYSRDGKWITYAHCPDGSVWRSALDGSERLQLTAPPFSALNPRWSPDGKQITFFGHRPGESSRIYVAPATGGAVRQLTHSEGGSIKDDDGSWSPDSTTLVFGATFGDRSMEPRQALALEMVDVRSQRISKLAGSEGLWSPRWSPDGRYIVAMGFPNRLWLYNLETRVATKLTTIGVGWPSWSRDSQYVYFIENPGAQWCRVRIKDGRVERVLNLAGLKLTALSLGWVGLTPDGSPISTRGLGGTEIYGLDWEAP